MKTLAKFILTGHNNNTGRTVTFRIDCKRSKYDKLYFLIEFLPTRGRGLYVGRLNEAATCAADCIELSENTQAPPQAVKAAKWVAFNRLKAFADYRADLPAGYSIDLEKVEI